MIGFVIWIIGLVLTIKAALEIWRIHAPGGKKVNSHYPGSFDQLGRIVVLLLLW